MSQKAMGNEKEGCRGEQACSLAVPPHLADNSHSRRITKITVGHTSPTTIMDACWGGNWWSTCWWGDTVWFDLSFICRCLPGKKERRLLLPEGRAAFFNYREAAGANRKEKRKQSADWPARLPLSTQYSWGLERTVLLCASFSTSLKWG